MLVKKLNAVLVTLTKLLAVVWAFADSAAAAALYTFMYCRSPQSSPHQVDVLRGIPTPSTTGVRWPPLANEGVAIMEHVYPQRQQRMVPHAHVAAHAARRARCIVISCIAEPWVEQVQCAAYVGCSSPLYKLVCKMILK